jgi:hypothetical protein
MVYQDAVKGARLSAKENPGVTIVVVHAPVENAEENGKLSFWTSMRAWAFRLDWLDGESN